MDDSNGFFTVDDSASLCMDLLSVVLLNKGELDGADSLSSSLIVVSGMQFLSSFLLFSSGCNIARGLYYLVRVTKSPWHPPSSATAVFIYQITFDTKKSKPQTRTGLLKVLKCSDILLSFEQLTVNNTARLQVPLHFYADVTSVGNLTGNHTMSWLSPFA